MKLHRKPVLGFFRGYQAQAPDQEGVLLKKGARNTSYQRRWFILRGNLLFYLEHRADRTPLGLILLENCQVAPRLGATEPYAFTIVTPGGDGSEGGRAYKLAAESQQELGAWLGALARVSWRRLAVLLPPLEAQYRELCQAAGHEPSSPPEHQDFLATLNPPSSFQELHERFGKEIRVLQLVRGALHEANDLGGRQSAGAHPLLMDD
ncbi:sesquipedalian-1-like [Sorex araneus]|uniref:sesquipedalian-1-like n=1 Tax=Sorex araneus TaxID=42254 RepID=UPI002433E51B|nr:sesquipedalian-1-like [Sorex araneus]XP_054990481.1 sesquipedalian-1-like [Sorex araneus]